MARGEARWHEERRKAAEQVSARGEEGRGADGDAGVAVQRSTRRADGRNVHVRVGGEGHCASAVLLRIQRNGDGAAPLWQRVRWRGEVDGGIGWIVRRLDDGRVGGVVEAHAVVRAVGEAQTADGDARASLLWA